MQSQANLSKPSLADGAARDHDGADGKTHGGGESLILEDFLPYRLSVLANTVSRGLARLYAERFDVTVPEWRVLAALGSFGAMSANGVAARTAMDKVQVSRAVARLIGNGRLARELDPADRRRAVLDFTEAGRAVYQAIVPLALDRERTLVAGLGAADRRTLDRLLSTVLDQARTIEAHDGDRPS